jgi:Neural proliferation differentiation control-1 protein (NPDC1)
MSEKIIVVSFHVENNYKFIPICLILTKLRFQYFSRAANERRGSMSEAESDDENDEGDYTVYECPGLASVIMNHNYFHFYTTHKC